MLQSSHDWLLLPGTEVVPDTPEGGSVEEAEAGEGGTAGAAAQGGGKEGPDDGRSEEDDQVRKHRAGALNP